MIARRLFLGGLLAGAVAPAIVRASSLMPIVPIKPMDPFEQLRRQMRIVEVDPGGPGMLMAAISVRSGTIQLFAGTPPAILPRDAVFRPVRAPAGPGGTFLVDMNQLLDRFVAAT